MEYCVICGNQVKDTAKFCTNCGNPISDKVTNDTGNDSLENTEEIVEANTLDKEIKHENIAENELKCEPVEEDKAVNSDSNIDNTESDSSTIYTKEDISNNKAVAMLCYLTGPMGILIAAVIAQKSEFAMFHVRQSLKFLVVDSLLIIVCCVLMWTVIVPIACGIMYLILFVIKIITICQIGSGKVKEPAIIRSLKFLK